MRNSFDGVGNTVPFGKDVTHCQFGSYTSDTCDHILFRHLIFQQKEDKAPFGSSGSSCLPCLLFALYTPAHRRSRIMLPSYFQLTFPNTTLLKFNIQETGTQLCVFHHFWKSVREKSNHVNPNPNRWPLRCGNVGV